MDQAALTDLHPALARHMRRAGIVPGAAVSSESILQFLERVNEFYRSADEDRYLLERSLDLSSREMATLNESLDAERTRLGLLLTTMQDGVCTLDPLGRIVWANPAAVQLLKLSQVDPAGQSFFALLSPLEDNDADLELDTTQHRQIRVTLTTGDGEMIPISYHVNELIRRDSALKTRSLSHETQVVVFRNIEGEMARERKLRKAREAAKAASKIKTELLANVSHEVRTPLHGILSMLQVMQMEGNLTDDQSSNLQHVRTAAESLLYLLNDILDLSKIEAGRVTLESIPFQPMELAESVKIVLASQAQLKGLLLSVKCGPMPRFGVMGDPTRLRQVLLNLTSNAIKFTASGSVVLELASTVREGMAELDIAVRDTGIGISPEHQVCIFEAFSQADGSITRRFGGTGLGLAICMKLARLMNASLTVDSQPGKGSCFRLRFTLPCAAAPVGASLMEDKPSIPLRPLRILYAEDNAVNQLTGRKMLGARGHRVHIVNNGRAALEAAASDNFDVILMDHQMPDMSGLEATRAIRGLGLHIPIVGASADASTEDRERFLSAGMNGFIGKPFSIQTVERELARVLAGVAGGRPATTTQSTDFAHQPR